RTHLLSRSPLRAIHEIYPLPLHDALPIFHRPAQPDRYGGGPAARGGAGPDRGNPDRRLHREGELIMNTQPASTDPGAELGNPEEDRKSTRLNSSHVKSSYAGFCLKIKRAA